FRVAGGFFAVGSDATNAPRSPLLWVSPDARDWRQAGPPPHWGRAGANGEQAVIFARATDGTTKLEAWVSEDGRQWTQLSFSGDVADIPGFEVALGQPSRIEGIFVAPPGV